MTNPAAAARLRALYDAALDAAQPGPATHAAVEQLPLERTARRWIVAIGKAAPAMTAAVLDALDARGLDVAGGLVVGTAATPPPHPRVAVHAGDHPVPGVLSFAAAEELGELVQRVDAGDDVLVLVSGGTSSLVAAPVPGIPHDDIVRLFHMLLGSGADIHAMNAVRRRFTRWGAGRLAVALAPARLHVLVASDVPGDDLATIGSGPCHPDPLTAAELVALLERLALLGHLPGAMRDQLEAVRAGRLPETPKAGDAAFARVTHQLVVSNRQALEGAAIRAGLDGLSAQLAPFPLEGEAARCGERIARELIAHRARQRRDRGARAACVLWGGETTVTLGNGLCGEGGRSQELALAAARVLGDAGAAADGITLLAAGTDGRDGPTDAAGALVDRATWDAIARSGGNPAVALDRHDAYAALARAGALVRTGPTGTNVMDVVIALLG